MKRPRLINYKGRTQSTRPRMAEPPHKPGPSYKHYDDVIGWPRYFVSGLEKYGMHDWYLILRDAQRNQRFIQRMHPDEANDIVVYEHLENGTASGRDELQTPIGYRMCYINGSFDGRHSGTFLTMAEAVDEARRCQLTPSGHRWGSIEIHANIRGVWRAIALPS